MQKRFSLRTAGISPCLSKICFLPIWNHTKSSDYFRNSNSSQDFTNSSFLSNDESSLLESLQPSQNETPTFSLQQAIQLDESPLSRPNIMTILSPSSSEADTVTGNLVSNPSYPLSDSGEMKHVHHRFRSSIPTLSVLNR